MKVTLFPTCLGDRFFAEAAADAVRLLRHVGAEVTYEPRATCCGQPAFNAGHKEAASDMARSLVDALDAADQVVLPSGSCAAMMREHLPHLLEGKDADRARALADRTWELAEFLVRVVGVTSLGRGLEGRRLAYHHGCHALRTLGERAEPVLLLREGGAEVVEWTADTECCGFGGLFSVKMPAVSAAMADRKLDTLPPSIGEVTSADGGCLLQLRGRARRRGRTVAFRPLASLLWQAVR